ncbi:MAG: hypothetical protein OXJ62_14140 [Spirochaetaceae bacterium]|nr:hypothetical protein [Spirochaetaceae bacterium]
MGSLFDSRRLVRVNLHVDPDQREAVRRMAKRADVTPSKVYRAALREGLAVLERQMQEAEAKR